jgi:hypothetical protein
MLPLVSAKAIPLKRWPSVRRVSGYEITATLSWWVQHESPAGSHPPRRRRRNLTSQDHSGVLDAGELPDCGDPVAGNRSRAGRQRAMVPTGGGRLACSPLLIALVFATSNRTTDTPAS